MGIAWTPFITEAPVAQWLAHPIKELSVKELGGSGVRIAIGARIFFPSFLVSLSSKFIIGQSEIRAD